MAQRVERRLAAILAADIVGYSRLTERDEAGTLALIKDLRERVIDPLLAEYKGHIVKLMGDGAIAEFGSVVDAVACAVAVQNATAGQQAEVPADRRIVFRIGVNLGDVVVEATTCSATGSMLPRAWSSSASPAACSSPAPPTTTSRVNSVCRSTSRASSGSRTSSARCAPIECGWTGPPRPDVCACCRRRAGACPLALARSRWR
jgi:hypothetical protein